MTQRQGNVKYSLASDEVNQTDGLKRASDTVVAFEHVSFRYRSRAQWVLEDFTWSVPVGKTVLLGPNGAGKTTLLALAADILRAQSGRVRIGPLVAGRRTDRSEFRRSTGWMPQMVRAVSGLTCREQVAYAGWLKGMSRAEAWRRSTAALEKVGLGALAGKLASEVSGGQLRRAGLAQLLVHEAATLLLDEPTVGLDPTQRAVFREILAELRSAHRVIVSTHQVDDLSDIYDTVVVLDQGVIRHESPVNAFLDLAPASAERRGEAAYQRLVAHDH
ncbi:MAG TPA: ATP-binding cassette domain-containing protein [Propionibacteriaceae bacterium]|nr:ATP-binding cassette domain-containing protein [Propionibacteriaceae bacterium]